MFRDNKGVNEMSIDEIVKNTEDTINGCFQIKVNFSIGIHNVPESTTYERTPGNKRHHQIDKETLLEIQNNTGYTEK